MKDRVIGLKNSTGKKVRIMFQDEAGFGRINTPKYCWCEEGYRPSVPCYHIREYVYAYGAVDPIDGDDFFRSLYTKYSGISQTFARTKSLAQNSKKQFSEAAIGFSIFATVMIVMNGVLLVRSL